MTRIGPRDKPQRAPTSTAPDDQRVDQSYPPQSTGESANAPTGARTRPSPATKVEVDLREMTLRRSNSAESSDSAALKNASARSSLQSASLSRRVPRRDSSDSIASQESLCTQTSQQSNASHLSTMRRGSARLATERTGTNRAATLAEKVKHLMEKDAHLELNETEAKIAKTFVLDRHMKAIGQMTKTLRCALSIRESGASTLRCLKLGAAAKGHDILEKTIKKSSVEKAYPENVDAVMKQITDAQMDGYVGHWDSDTGQLKGIYVGPEAREIPGVAEKLKNNGNTAHPNEYYPVDLSDLEGSLKELKTGPNWASIPFTGDYDLHDLLSFIGQPGPVPQGSEEERKILDAFNAVVGVVDKDTRPVESEHKNVVRHGPQHNFIAYMRTQEGETESFVGAVAMPSFPLAMCNRGEWSIINNLDELKAFYLSNKVNLKTSWLASEDYFEDKGGGMLGHKRSSSKDSSSTRSR
jgi:hypothetical protein